MENGVLRTQMNTQLLFCIKVNKQLVKLGKYFADFNFHGSQLTAKYRENWTTRKFPILRYVLDAQKNSLFETVLLSTSNICFG